MGIKREIVKRVKGKRTVDGAGVNLVRVFGYHDTQDFDPFLMLDAFDSENPEDYVKGFPWHPHRGIETITYLIQGDIEHGDSLGNKGSILDGDCQWMTAGSGIIHQEMPKPSERMLGAQLWLNMPAKDKMTDPKYGDIKKENVPVVQEEGVRIHILSGKYKGVSGAFEGNYIKADYFDIELDSGKDWSLTLDSQETLFVYMFYGKAVFGNEREGSEPRQALLFGPGDEFFVRAQEDTRFILLKAKPLNEPVAWGGPIVMNTKEELNLAFKELDEDTFIKKGKKEKE